MAQEDRVLNSPHKDLWVGRHLHREGQADLAAHPLEVRAHLNGQNKTSRSGSSGSVQRLKTTPTIVLFRQDLRLADHPALWAGVQRGPVLPVFIHDPLDEHGAAWRWWHDRSLTAFSTALAERGIPLILRRGDLLATVRELVVQSGASAVFWNRRYDPSGMARDRALKAALLADGVEARSFPGDLLAEPWELLRGDRPYRVFTPFWKAFLARSQVVGPLPIPEHLQAPSSIPSSDNLDSLAWRPRKPDWSAGLATAWEPGENGAWQRFRDFLDTGLYCYDGGRNEPARHCVSRLSPHLAHGELSPRQIWQQMREAASRHPQLAISADAFLRELGWREFSWHLLYHFPSLPHTSLRPEFVHFPWREERGALGVWQRGRTGYPLIDAGMRELWQTGWMHNRVRMIAASFLVKDLRIPWQKGAAWFQDTLVDADLANNSVSWQWVAGCGADAVPYFRIFNPVLQSRNFDPNGVYLRRWLPELDSLDDKGIHAPANVGELALARAGIVLGRDYPFPMVDHAMAREAALQAFTQLKK